MNILVALENTELSSPVLVTAKQMAKAFNAKLWLLHIAEPEPDFVGFDAGPPSVRESMATHFHEEHKLIQQLGDQLREENFETTALLIQGSFAETILEQADKLTANYIIVGAHRKGIFAQMLFGSTSHSVIYKANVPVVVVPLR
jgi:nucleotide-binding universal stress UspA family protein